MIQHILFPKTGWIILHVIAISALFLLGYSIHF